MALPSKAYLVLGLPTGAADSDHLLPAVLEAAVMCAPAALPGLRPPAPFPRDGK